MDVYLKKRWDLIPNIVEITKGYANYEKSTLEKITSLRAKSYNSLSDVEKIKSDEVIKNNIVQIVALAEEYPELKANENFKNLATQLTQVEEDIANSRKYYSAVVRDYNNKVEMFPNNFIARFMGFKIYEMFEAELEAKDNVKIDY